MIKVLSLDGGGARGIATTLYLAALEKEIEAITGDPDTKLGDYFDLLAGTSTGGVIVGILTTPDEHDPKSPRYSARDAFSFYSDFLKYAFTNVRSKGNIGIFREKYDGKSLAMILRMFFGSTQLRQLVKPCLITSYEVMASKATFFCSHDYWDETQLAEYGIEPIEEFPRKPQWYLRDICRASSAAPIIFEPATINPISKEESMTFIDGGIFANNPSLSAYSEVRAKWAGNNTARNMIMVSIGTGALPGKVETGGYLSGWGGGGRQLINLLFKASADTTHYAMERIVKSTKTGQYWRFNFRLEEDVQIDSASEKDLNFLLDSILVKTTKEDVNWLQMGIEVLDYLNLEDRKRLSELAKNLVADKEAEQVLGKVRRRDISFNPRILRQKFRDFRRKRLERKQNK